MPNIRIKDIPTTASATSSTDFIGIDGSANGTRKLNAYSPTFGGNLTVSGTGLSSVAGTLNVTGALLAHQTAALNMAHEGSSLSQLVSYGADASTYGRLNVTLRKAGTGVGAVTALALTSTDATFGGNLTVSGTTGTIGSNSGFTWDLGSGGSFTALSTGRPTITAAVASGNNAGAALSLLPRGGGSRRTWNLETDTTEAGDCVLRQSTTEAGSTFTNALYFSAARNATLAGNLTVSGTGTSSVAGNWLVGTATAAASGARLQAQLTGTDGTVSTLLSLRKNTNSAGTGVAIDFIPESTDVPLAKLSAVRTNVNNGYTDFRFSTWNGSTLVEQLRLVGQTGNFLIGTNVDSSALLQVGTNTTTAAGGMKFGTDTALFRSAAGALQLETSATAVFEIDGGAGNTRGVVIQAAGTEQAAITVAASGTSLLLSTGSPRTTALTLDSDQNATFAKKISANGSTTWASASSAQVFWNTGSGANLAGSGSSYDVSVLNKNGDLAFYVPTGTQNTTFAGNVGLGASPQSGFQLDVQGLTILRGDLYMGSGKDIRLGNAYQAGAPTATGYLTIKDSNGTAYKIPAVAV